MLPKIRIIAESTFPTRPASLALAGLLKTSWYLLRRRRFVPRVMAMMVGEKLILRNNDPKLHIVHSYLRQRTVFNASLPFPNHPLEITRKIRKPGLLKVSCDTHAWMRGYIYVFGHPYFAVTDDHGRFIIPKVPAGRYVLSAWHEKTGVQSKEIEISGQEDLSVNFGFTGYR